MTQNNIFRLLYLICMKIKENLQDNTEGGMF